jgi:hypothetical protein
VLGGRASWVINVPLEIQKEPKAIVPVVEKFLL